MELIGKYLFWGTACGVGLSGGLGLLMFFEAWLNQSTTYPLDDVLAFRSIIVLGIAWVTVPIGTFHRSCHWSYPLLGSQGKMTLARQDGLGYWLPNL